MFRKRKKELAEVIAANEAFQNFSYLVGIERAGRMNKFIFRRNGKIFEIETMGLWADNVDNWREELLK